MILESIVTTQNIDGTTNVAPMGPWCEDPGGEKFNGLNHFELRPFCTSTTYQNLKRTRQGVLHVTDDVGLFARSAIGISPNDVALVLAEKINGKRLADCCRFFEFETTWIDDSGNRSSMQCQTVFSKRIRDFFGFNRARHAVLEASILATRIDFLPFDTIRTKFEELETLVQKTGGIIEHEAFQLLVEYTTNHQSGQNAKSLKTVGKK